MKSMKTVLGCLIALVVIAMCGSVTSPLSAKSVNALPQQKKPPASKVVPHPENWITLTDKKKGYSFDVPQGTVSGTQKSSELDLFMAVVPEPYGVGVLVMAFKDPKLSKDDLINFATGAMNGMNVKNFKVVDVVELNDDYSLGTYTALNNEGKPIRGKVLVATDVTDNYVMIVGTEVSKYKANEEIIDEIWGSFTMRSGGASGKS